MVWNDSIHSFLYPLLNPLQRAERVCLSTELNSKPGMVSVICLYRFWKIDQSCKWLGLGGSIMMPKKGSMRWQPTRILIDHSYWTTGEGNKECKSLVTSFWHLVSCARYASRLSFISRALREVLHWLSPSIYECFITIVCTRGSGLPKMQKKE